MTFKIVSLLILFSLTNLAFSSENNVVPSTNRVGEEIIFTFYTYRNHKALEKAYKQITGKKRHDENRSEFTVWNINKPYTCEIHIIRHPNRTAFSQKEYKLWGHGLVHCIYLNFHPDKHY